MKSKDILLILLICTPILLIVILFTQVQALTKNPSTTESLNKKSNSLQADQVIKIENGKQIINMVAKGGYWPKTISAQANIDTVLKVETKNTYDCSSSIAIPSMNLNKVLDPNSVSDIELGIKKPGEVLAGTCSMGMYGFKINFN